MNNTFLPSVVGVDDVMSHAGVDLPSASRRRRSDIMVDISDPVPHVLHRGYFSRNVSLAAAEHDLIHRV